MVLCPECDNTLDLDEDELEEGDVVACDECGMDFEVITAAPLVLHPLSEDDEEEEELDDDEVDE